MSTDIPNYHCKPDRDRTTTAESEVDSTSTCSRHSSQIYEALRYARDLLGEAERDEINLRAELEKWDRAFGHLLANVKEQTPSEI